MNLPPASSTANWPIIFIHSGGDSYLACSLTQARKSNPRAEIFLIGDRFNRGFPGIRHLEWRAYSERADAFAKIYQHRNTNPRHYELFCLQRWLILNEVLQRQGLEGCLYLDSDVLLYERVEKIAAGLAGVDWTTSSTSPHFTFWRNREALQQFCAFLFEAYTKPEFFSRLEQHYLNLQTAGRAGGVCDMTVFREFAALSVSRVRDIYPVADVMPCDHAMGQDEGGFEMQAGIKKIEWRDRKPWCRHLATGRIVQFQALHFQGPSKGHIFKHVQLGAGPQWLYLWNRLVAKKGKYWQKWVRNR